MNGMFKHLELLVDQQEKDFYSEITQTVKKQQEAISRDNQNKVPGFVQRLALKYNDLQHASSLAGQQGLDPTIAVLEQYLNIFTDLDAEFEKYFNEFESFGRLQRLLEKDPNELVKQFSDLVETNMRVDYNIKNSFVPIVGQRLHSFQWNQRNINVFRVKNSAFERRSVTMDHEVPLYSRSVATEKGDIFLIGGYIKRLN